MVEAERKMELRKRNAGDGVKMRQRPLETEIEGEIAVQRQDGKRETEIVKKTTGSSQQP